MTDDDNVDIRPVQTARLRLADGSAMISATKAIRAAGLEDGGSFRFDPYTVDELGMLAAIGSEIEVDGRGDPLARNIRAQGTGGKTLVITIPPDALGALLGDREVDWESPPELNVWAGEKLLAFDLPEERTVSIDRSTNSDRESESEGEGNA